MDLKRNGIVLALALLVLWRNLPGALLCLWPRLLRARSLPDGAPEVNETLFEQMEGELVPLGFERLGAHLESPPLKRSRLVYDFVQRGEKTFASAFLDGPEVDLYLLTAFESGGGVLTADHARISAEQAGRFLSGGLPGATPVHLLAAHRRRVESLKVAGQTERSDLSLEARVSVACQWVRSAGAREVRLKNANAFILSLATLVMLGAMIAGVMR